MQTLENRTYEELAVGERASLSHQVKERDLLLFAAVSGDVNPVHLDEAFAAATPFKGRSSQAMAAEISAPENMPWAMRPLNGVAPSTSVRS